MWLPSESMTTVVLVTFVTSWLNLMNSDSILFTDTVLTVLVLAGMTIFCCNCRVVSKQVHANSCIGDLCYIKVELNE